MSMVRAPDSLRSLGRLPGNEMVAHNYHSIVMSEDRLPINKKLSVATDTYCNITPNVIGTFERSDYKQ